MNKFLSVVLDLNEMLNIFTSASVFFWESIITLIALKPKISCFSSSVVTRKSTCTLPQLFSSPIVIIISTQPIKVVSAAFLH